MNTGHELRIAAGVSFVWNDLPRLVETLDGIPPEIERLHFRRRKASHRGIAELKNLKCLWLHQANQALVDEISELPNLEVLHIRGLTATSLEPLGRNRKLKRLMVIGGTKIESMDWVSGLPAEIEALFLEGFSRASDLEPLGGLANLTALGIEGGMDTKIRIDTLEPLAKLQRLRYLFLAGARVMDKSLAPIGRIPSLEHLECTINFPDREFLDLRKSLPNVKCDWIELIEEHGSLRKGRQRYWRGSKATGPSWSGPNCVFRSESRLIGA